MSNYYAIAPYSAELYHHGIKGQKWGVRRFQNADGSLTAAGKRRAAKDAKEGIVRKTDGEWRRTKTKGGHLQRSINASKETRIANGKRLVEEGETIASRTMKRAGSYAINQLSAGVVGAGMGIASVALAAIAGEPVAAIALGATVAYEGYTGYKNIRNIIGAYQDISDISAYNQTRRNR